MSGKNFKRACLKQDTQSLCSGTTQRDAVGSKLGEGFRREGYMFTVADSG